MDVSNKCLKEIESFPEKDTAGSTPLIEKVMALRRKKIKDFTIEDLRLMIAQQQGLAYLVPLGLEVLEKNPFSEGDYYEGDLLVSLLTCKADFWKEHPTAKISMDRIVRTVIDELDKEYITLSVKRKIMERISQYQSYGF